MKKLVMTAVALTCAASIASAQTVTSANMVGYAKVTAIKGQLTLTSLNFEPSSPLVADIIGTQLPVDSKLHIWNKGGGGYTTVPNNTRGGWGNTATISLGEAFWIELPASAPQVTNVVIISGEVLLSETNSVSIGGPIDATGFYYPVDILWGDTDLATQLPIDSKLHVWNGAGYNTFPNNTRGGWGAGNNVLITPTTGFWVEAPATSWDEVRPFTP